MRRVGIFPYLSLIFDTETVQCYNLYRFESLDFIYKPLNQRDIEKERGINGNKKDTVTMMRRRY